MNDLHCTNSDQCVAAELQDTWTPELREHHGSCSGCQQSVRSVVWLRSAAESLEATPPISADGMLWRAKLRQTVGARAVGRRRIGKRLLWGQALCIGPSIILLLFLMNRWIQGPVNTLIEGSFASTVALAPPVLGIFTIIATSTAWWCYEQIH